jgi:plasmid maintenance system antidote protein VapI
MLRLERGISKLSLARSTGASRQQLWRVMTGRSALTRSLAGQLGVVLGVTPDELMAMPTDSAVAPRLLRRTRRSAASPTAAPAAVGGSLADAIVAPPAAVGVAGFWPVWKAAVTTPAFLADPAAIGRALDELPSDRAGKRVRRALLAALRREAAELGVAVPDGLDGGAFRGVELARQARPGDVPVRLTLAHDVHPVASPKHEDAMDRGIDFLKSQVNNAVMQHGTFVQNLVDHEKEAEDPRFRNLCSKHIPMMQQHQRMLEDYQRELGAETGAAKKVLGKALGMARDLADSVRESDFLRLVGDIVTARQSEDTFKTFREAGRALGNQRLLQIGEAGERGHDEYVREANRLVQELFVEHARGTTVQDAREAGLGASSEPRTNF